MEVSRIHGSQQGAALMKRSTKHKINDLPHLKVSPTTSKRAKSASKKQRTDNRWKENEANR